MQPHIDTIRNNFEELSDAASFDPDLANMELYLGCEIYYYPSITQWLDEGRVSSLADSRFVLLEFGYTMDERTIREGVSRVASEGFYPIVAHVERYKKLVGNLKAVDDLISRGAYIQINSEALRERFKIRSFAKKLLKNEMVHFVATDAHDTFSRAPRLFEAAEYIRKHYGGDLYGSIFFDNPAMIINKQYRR